MQPKREPLAVETAVEMWKEIRGIPGLDRVSIVQERAEYEWDAEKRGVEKGETWLRVSVGGEVSSGTLKIIQSIAMAAGREAKLDGSVLLID